MATVSAIAYIAGDERRIYHLSKGLDSTLVEHHIVSLIKPATPEIENLLRERYDGIGAVFHSLGATRREDARKNKRSTRVFHDSVNVAKTLKRLVQYCIRHRIQAIEARCGYAIAFSVAAAKIARIPVVVGTDYHPSYWQNKIQIGKYIHHQLDYFISDSQNTVNNFVDLFSLERRRTKVIQNGLSPLLATKTREEVRNELKVPVNAKMITKVAQFIPYKGHLYLIESIPAILEAFPDTHFVLCGFTELNPDTVESLRKRIFELNIGHRVQLRRWPGDISDVWNASDIHVHATLFDSSPIAIHESMAMKIPVISTRIGGIPELIEDGVTGFIVPAKDSSAIAERVKTLLRDPERCKKMGDAAYQRHLNHHTSAHMAKQLYCLVDEALAEKQ